MNKLLVIILLTSACVLLFFEACKTSKKSTAVAAPEPEWMYSNTNSRAVRDRELFTGIQETIAIDTAYIHRDTLHILTPKITGCDAGKFSLVWNGMFTKSIPPQTSVRLLQVSEPECKKQHRFHLTYNISNVKMKADSARTLQPVSIRLGGWKNTLPYPATTD